MDFASSARHYCYVLQKILHENKIKSPQTKNSLVALFEEKDFTPLVSFYFLSSSSFGLDSNLELIYIIIVLVRSWSVHALVGFFE